MCNSKQAMVTGRKEIVKIATVCYARVHEFRPCEDLRNLDEALEAAQGFHNILCNGLDLRFDADWHCMDCPGITRGHYDRESGCHTLKKVTFKGILNQLLIKYLKIHWRGGNSHGRCPEVLFLPELLHHNRYSLEEIQIGDAPSFWEWVHMCSDALSLPNLRVLTWKPLELNAARLETIMALIGFAPYLQDLLVCVSGAILRRLRPECHGIIKSL